MAHSKLGRSVGVGLERIQNCVGSAYDISGVTKAHKGVFRFAYMHVKVDEIQYEPRRADRERHNR